LVVAQIVLLPQWFNKKNIVQKPQSKKPSKKNPIKMISPTRPVQNGTLVNLDMGEKNYMGWGGGGDKQNS
jgi:hypothetical protein